LVQIEKRFDLRSDVGERIRAIPDFIVIDKTGKPEFVEVKFRWNAKITESDLARLKNLHKFWNAKLVIVNCWKQPYFQTSFPPYFDKNKNFMTRPLREESQWHIDKEAYDECETLVNKYLTPTLIPKKN
jgi:hypothetical protein